LRAAEILARAAAAAMATLGLAGCSGGGAAGEPHVRPELATATVFHDAGPAPDLGLIDGGPVTDPAMARIEKALKLVSRARGLSILRPVKSRVMPRKELIAYVKGRVTKEIPSEAIVREGRVLSLLGFLPTDYDYLAGTLDLLDAQLAGLYEPEDGTMYIADDLDGAVADSTLDHELTHALQDQHYDLKSRTKYTPGKSDAQSALSALSEGDAMSTMVDVLMRRQKAPAAKTALDVPDAMWRAQAAGMNEGKGASAPAVMKAQLVAPYIDGTIFVQALRRAGGWTAVDNAWREPPTSTEQLLHLDKWNAREEPLPVNAPPPPDAAWTLADADTYGELEMRILLSQWFGEEDGAYLASGWGGDRGALYERGDETAFALRVRYDEGVKPSPHAFFDHLTKKLGKAAVRKRDLVCFERADRGPLLVQLEVPPAGGIDRTELLIVAGGVHVQKGPMSSSSTCAQTIAWGKRIEATP
jgi:hypothetical protein